MACRNANKTNNIVATVTPRPSSFSLEEELSTYLSTKVCPDYLANIKVTWLSSNNSVATVCNGVITAVAKGSARITATATNRMSRSYTVTITRDILISSITVDPREKVTVKKDSHSFYVKFANGKVWQNIGIDLLNRQKNYTCTSPPDMCVDNYYDLIKEEQRYFDNMYEDEDLTLKNTYSEEELAFLYMFDPYGIEFYLKNLDRTTKEIIFKRSITDTFSETCPYLKEYANEDVDNVDDLIEWIKNLFSSLCELKNNDEKITVLNINDIKIYNKINNQKNYLVLFDTGTKSLFIDRIIELCK